ncbi:MAG: hypothetical protein V3U87_06910 [Methylococcaceae bacterium]
MGSKLVNEILKAIEAPQFLVAVTFFILWSHKQIREHFSVKKVKHTEALSQLIEYMNEYGDKNFFIIEQLFLDHFKTLIPYKGIKLFLSTDKPTENILDYISGKKYVEFSSNYRYVIFYKDKKGLLREIVLAGIQYVVLFGLGVMMLISSHKVIEYELLPYIAWFVISIYLCCVGIMGLDNKIKIDSANKLVEKLGEKCITRR